MTDGNDFIDRIVGKLHYDKWLDTVLDAEGNDKRDYMGFFGNSEPDARKRSVVRLLQTR